MGVVLGLMAGVLEETEVKLVYKIVSKIVF